MISAVIPSWKQVSFKMPQAECNVWAAVPSFDQQLNQTLMLRVWGLSLLVICGFIWDVEDVVQGEGEPEAAPTLFMELRGHACGSQAGRALGVFPITCDWGGTTQPSQPQWLWPCLGRAGRSEQVWDILLATITRPPSAAKPGKCFHRYKNDHQTWLFTVFFFLILVYESA